MVEKMEWSRYWYCCEVMDLRYRWVFVSVFGLQFVLNVLVANNQMLVDVFLNVKGCFDFVYSFLVNINKAVMKSLHM